jgi:hypothetical protein
MSYKEEVEKILRSRPRRPTPEGATAAQALEVLVDNHHEAILELQQALRALAAELDTKNGEAPSEPAGV